MKKNNYKIDLVRCKICGYETNNHQAFNSHLSKRHHIKSKEYYDIYLKSDIDGICKECGNPTAFKNMWDGYRDFCCNSCAQKNIDIQNKKIKTSLENLGKTQYKTAIKVWSILDVDKYNCAIKNQLNFIILWNKQDIERYINTLI